MLPPKCRVFFAKEVGGYLIERYAYVLDSDGVSDPGLLLQVARNVGNERFFGHAIPSVCVSNMKKMSSWEAVRIDVPWSARCRVRKCIQEKRPRTRALGADKALA